MKFRCPCCKMQIVPSDENFDQGAQTSSASVEENDQFISIAIGAMDTNGPSPHEVPADLPEIVVDNTIETESLQDATVSEISVANNGILPASLQLLILSWIQPMENKANTKLFGSAKAVKNEQTRHKEAGWIIHPCSAFRLYWNMFMMLLLVMNMYALPVVITFFTDALPLSWTVFNILSDIFFLTDLLLNFRTGIMVNDMSYRFILEPRKIAM
ncbi:potassium sodium hyperpolarization-activated cyclic nucleotide-gated channel 2 isoform X5, partial [Paramuricea clavata]